MTETTIETRPFGSTGHTSTRVIFGAAALGTMSPARAEATLATVAEFGVNHVDTAASYGDAEIRLTPFLAEHRGEVFLATKTGERTAGDARAELERSLAEAPFSSVLFPWNHSLASSFPDYAADVTLLRSVCADQGVAAQTIKSIARRRWRDTDTPHHSWYEPINDASVRARAIEFVLAEPDLFLNTSSDARLLRETLETAAGTRHAAGPDQLADDRAEAGIEPLFDGADLEVIH